MEQISPLLISFVLFFLGIEVARELSDADRDAALARLRELAPAAFPELAYPVFSLTQRFC